jgi:chromosome segregation ATPase
MDEQFVNVFIQKQKALIDDLQQKLVVSETRSHVFEQRVTDHNERIRQLEGDLQAQTKALEKSDEAKAKIKEQLKEYHSTNDNLVNQLHALQVQYDDDVADLNNRLTEAVKLREHYEAYATQLHSKYADRNTSPPEPK